MKPQHLYSAKFYDGKVVSILSRRHFTHAIRAGYTETEHGIASWAGSEEQALKRAKGHEVAKVFVVKTDKTW